MVLLRQSCGASSDPAACSSSQSSQPAGSGQSVQRVMARSSWARVIRVRSTSNSRSSPSVTHETRARAQLEYFGCHFETTERLDLIGGTR